MSVLNCKCRQITRHFTRRTNSLGSLDIVVFYEAEGNKRMISVAGRRRARLACCWPFVCRPRVKQDPTKLIVVSVPNCKYLEITRHFIRRTHLLCSLDSVSFYEAVGNKWMTFAPGRRKAWLACCQLFVWRPRVKLDPPKLIVVSVTTLCPIYFSVQ